MLDGLIGQNSQFFMGINVKVTRRKNPFASNFPKEEKMVVPHTVIWF
jgi:hypothetical protein